MKWLAIDIVCESIVLAGITTDLRLLLEEIGTNLQWGYEYTFLILFVPVLFVEAEANLIFVWVAPHKDSSIFCEGTSMDILVSF